MAVAREHRPHRGKLKVEHKESFPAPRESGEKERLKQWLSKSARGWTQTIYAGEWGIEGITQEKI